MSNHTPSKSMMVYRRRRAEFIASRGGACEQCGSVDRIEIDHVDPKNKLMAPGAALQRRAEIREPELAKCQILCWDCHRAKSIRENLARRTHGRHAMYTQGCRCAPCTAAHKLQARLSRAKRQLVA